MSNLAGHFNEFLQQQETISEEQWSDTDQRELDELMVECEAHRDRLLQCESLESLIREANGINRHIASRFESFGFEDFDFDTYPLASFTELPSSINQTVAMESFDRYKEALIAGGIAGLLMLIAKFVRWLIGRDKRGGNNPSTAKEAMDTHEDKAKSIDKRLGKIDSAKKDIKRTSRKAARDTDGSTTHTVDLPTIDEQGDIKDMPHSYEVANKDRSVEEIKNRLLANWDSTLDEVFVRSFRAILEKDPSTAFNVTFLKKVVDEGLYDELQDVAVEMNTNLNQIKKDYEVGVKASKRMRGVTDSAKHATISRDIRQVSGPEVSQFSAKKAKALIERYNTRRDDLDNMQTDYIPLGQYSASFNDRELEADPAAVVREVFDTFRQISKARLSYRGEDLESPKDFLEEVQKWIEDAKRDRAQSQQAKEFQDEFLTELNKVVVAITSAYGGIYKILTTHTKEISMMDRFLVKFTEHYNRSIIEYVRYEYRMEGYNDESEYRKELADIVKQLRID